MTGTGFHEHIGYATVSDADSLPAILRPSEVAVLFRVSDKTVTRWAQAGRLPCFMTLGGHRRFRRRDVLDLLTAQEVGGR